MFRYFIYVLYDLLTFFLDSSFFLLILENFAVYPNTHLDDVDSDLFVLKYEKMYKYFFLSLVLFVTAISVLSVVCVLYLLLVCSLSLSLSFSVFWFFLFRKCTIQEKYDFLQWVCETRTPTQINSKVCFGCTFVRFRGLLTCSPRNIASNICICLFERQKDSLNTKLNGSNEKRIKKKHTRKMNGVCIREYRNCALFFFGWLLSQ